MLFIMSLDFQHPLYYKNYSFHFEGTTLTFSQSFKNLGIDCVNTFYTDVPDRTNPVGHTCQLKSHFVDDC